MILTMPTLSQPVLARGRMAALPQPTLLTASGLTIRPWSTEDCDDVLRAFSDSAIRMWHLTEIKTTAEAEEWIEVRQRSWSAEIGGNWAVADQANGIVGRVGLRDVNLFAGHAESTYWVLPEFRRKGIAVAAMTELARWTLDVLGIHRLIVTHSTKNHASCGVAEKVGFNFEGTMRSQLMHTDGWHDMHLHALIQSA